ncbi:sulfur carrier protein ThiS [bacterium]|nr:sulfur carrier protein ThiS [bacterium]MBU1024747.1 sulfur carrier protein ThiS [bacterium]
MIKINDMEIEWRDGMTIQDAMNEVKFSFPLVVVSVNDEIIPQKELPKFVLQDGDKVEVLHLTSGG